MGSDSVESVCITGGSGYVGAAIVRAFAELRPACKLIVLDKNPEPRLGLEKLKVEYVRADVTVEDEVVSALERVRPQVVIHTAGLVPPLSERYARRLEKIVKLVNVEGTRIVLKASKKVGVKAFVYTSSCCAVIDDVRNTYANIDERWPVSPESSIYGESKVAAEALVQAANGTTMSTCILRPAVIFGEGDHQLVPSIHACIAKGETPFCIGEGTNLWDTVYVGNVADTHVLAADNLMTTGTAAGEIFFIQNNEPTSFREFSLAVWSNFGHYPPFEVNIPSSLAWFIGFLAECVTFLTRTPTTLSRGSVLDATAMRYASGVKAEEILGYRPRVGLEEGLRRSCDEYAKRLQTTSRPGAKTGNI